MATRKKYDLDDVTNSYLELCRRVENERHRIERDWFRNVLFYCGIQWITYNLSTKRWEPKNLDPWVPRPVTNKFAATSNTIVQVFSQKAPDATTVPATDAPDDVASAKVAEKAMPVILDEAREAEARKEMAAWMVLTGNCFLHPCYDPDPEYGSQEMQVVECQEPGCGYRGVEFEFENGCPQCQSANIMPLLDESGAPVTEEEPVGRCAIDVLSPFEVLFDMGSRSFTNVDELVVRRKYSLEKARDRWGEDIQPDPTGQGSSTGMNFLRAIAYAASSGKGYDYVGGGGSGESERTVTIDFYWKKPCKKYPRGIAAIFAGNSLRNEKDMEIPYEDQKGLPIWPFQHIEFDKVPGRIYSKTPMDDVAEKQVQRNKLESLILLIIARTAGPQWLMPKNLGITPITGRPGELIEYPAGIDPKTIPQRISGENVPTSVIAWLEKIDSDIEALAGTFEVLRGAAPAGVTAGTALRLLLERAVTRYTPVISDFEKKWGKVCQHLICIFRQFGRTPRVQRILGPGNSWEVSQFMGSQIAGGVDVVVEAGSAIPKTSVGQQALIQDLQASGFINSLNPETQYECLKMFGMTKLLGTADEDIRHAERENWDFLKSGKEPVLNLIVDSHQIHMMVHRKLALTSDFAMFPQEVQQLWIQHMMQHQMAMMPGPAISGEEGGGPTREPASEPGAAESPESAGAPPATQQEQSVPPAFAGAV